MKAFMANGDTEYVKKIIEEEVMHFITVRGWSLAYSSSFGVSG